jgi:hypothetical protein
MIENARAYQESKRLKLLRKGAVMHGGTFEDKPLPSLDTINEHAVSMFEKKEAEMVQ